MKGRRRMLYLILVVVSCIAICPPLIKYLVVQSARPEGAIGNVLTRIWSSYFVDLNTWGLSRVSLDDNMVILDVGFGGGAGINQIMKQNDGHSVYGIDISEESVKTAVRLNERYIEEGQVTLAVGDVAELSFEEHFFDLIVACQTHIYWDDLLRGLTECYRVLDCEGQLLVICEADKIKYHLPEYQEDDKFVELLSNIGFRNVELFKHNNYIAFIAVK